MHNAHLLHERKGGDMYDLLLRRRQLHHQLLLGGCMQWSDVKIAHTEEDGIHHWVVTHYPYPGGAQITSTDGCKTFVVSTTGYKQRREVSREFPTLKEAMLSVSKWHNTNVNRHKKHREDTFAFDILTQLGRYDRHPEEAVPTPVGA